MGVYSATWEDDENNRKVELAVRYRLEGDQLELDSVTPASVIFFDPQSGAIRRSIKIWTDTARRNLHKSNCDTDGMNPMSEEIRDSMQAHDAA